MFSCWLFAALGEFARSSSSSTCFFALAICQPLVGLASLNSLDPVCLLLILLLHLTHRTSPWLPEASLFSNLARASFFVTPVTELGPVPDLILLLLVPNYHTYY